MSNNSSVSPQIPSYANEYGGGSLVAAATVMIVAGTILLLLRTYARHLTATQRGWDDHLLFPAWLLLVAACIVSYFSIPVAGAGWHIQVVGEKAVMAGKIVYVIDWFYLISSALSRLSILHMYLRIFTRRFTRICCRLIFWFLILFCIAGLISNQLQCLPISYLWDKNQNGWCFKDYLWWQVMNFPNIFADLVILLLPFQTLYTLQINLQRKLAIALVFLTGSMGLIASIIRTTRFFQDFGGSEVDSTWVLADLLAWTVVETGMYFCSACLIGLRPLVSILGKRLRATTVGPARQKRFSNAFFVDFGYHAEVHATGETRPRRKRRSQPLASGASDDWMGLDQGRDVGELATELDHSANDSPGALPPGQILVETTVDIESEPNFDVLPIQRPEPTWIGPHFEVQR